MYKSAGGMKGIVGGGALAATGFSTFAVVAFALALMLVGFALVRYSMLRRSVRDDG